MKRYTWLFFLLFVIQQLVLATPTAFQQQIESLPEVKAVQKIDHHPFFKEAYEVMIEQYLDHGNPQAGKFLQRVFVSDYNKYSPVIFVTEGYSARGAERSTYINELCGIVEANQLVVEHRYFGKSTPDDLNWEYLTIENATADLHRIYKIFQRIYNNQNKWIATGISKGGQHTMAYYTFFPDDMDIWVPYVGPVNFAIEDIRLEKFLNKVGTSACRKKVRDFQLTVLKNREKIQPLFDSLVAAEGYTFFIPTDEVLDYCVLEYSFSFWQWGGNCNEIPADTLPLHTHFEYLMKLSGPDYFSIEGTAPIKPFFVQSLKEFGYYGYETEPFEPYLRIDNAEGYIKEVFLKNEPEFKYDKKVSKTIQKAVQKGGKHMLMIYGEYDPWTAGAINPKAGSEAVMIVKPAGSHRTRINNMSYAQQAKIYMLLETWLEED
jgi:hypothetical protein